MIINLKTVANKTFSVNVDPSDTIAQVKQKIEQQGEYTADGMRIIFGGKVLDDNASVADSGIQEHHRNIVVVAKKLKAVVPKKKEEETTPAATTTTTTTTEAPKQPEAAATTTATTAATQESAPTTTAPPVTTTTTATTSPASNLPPVDSQLVTQFLEMGFEQAQIEECLRAAYNNPERAAEYLMTGIPDFVKQQMQQAPQQQQQTQQPAQQQQQQQQHADLAGLFGNESDILGGIGGGDNQLAQLMQSFPQFNQLRAAIQQNPHLLTPIMQRLAQSNPELVQIINQNPEAFIRLLNEPVPQMPQQQQQQGGGAFGQGLGGGMRPPPGTIMVTPQEKEAIDRLVGMGFDRVLAVQAYFASGKDENLAANLLLENPEMFMADDDDDMAQPGDQGEGDDQGMHEQ